MLIIDRITGAYAVCEQEDRSMIQIPLTLLPPEVREGDCLAEEENGSYVIDRQETLVRRNRNISLFNSLLADDEDEDEPDTDDYGNMDGDVDDIREDHTHQPEDYF